jgi:hypothetical protein
MRIHGNRVRQAKMESQGLSFHYLNGYHPTYGVIYDEVQVINAARMHQPRNDPAPDTRVDVPRVRPQGAMCILYMGVAKVPVCKVMSLRRRLHPSP